MIQLDTAEELVLHAFHEETRDRVGAEPGQRIPLTAIQGIGERGAGIDVDRALSRLQDLGYVEVDGDDAVLTEDGAARLYPAHQGEGGVHGGGNG